MKTVTCVLVLMLSAQAIAAQTSTIEPTVVVRGNLPPPAIANQPARPEGTNSRIFFVTRPAEWPHLVQREVSISIRLPDKTRTVMTDSVGLGTITDVPPGDVTVVARRIGFTMSDFKLRIPKNCDVVVELYMQQAMEAVNPIRIVGEPPPPPTKTQARATVTTCRADS